MKAIGYIRVSTADQADHGVSLDAQRGKLEAWAALNGYELASVHVDAGISGARADNRPALQEAVSEACKHKAALVVYSLSRLARSTRDALEIADRLDKAGADLVSLSEKLDTTSATGKLTFRLFSILAEFERDQIVERTRMAMEYKRSKGEYLGGAAPYGKRLVDGQLVTDDYEQGVIREARRMYVPGKVGLRAVAKHLNENGFTSRGKQPFQAVQVRAMVA
jgi:DNA invertase Pin-like site-specific DNA recombinase